MRTIRRVWRELVRFVRRVRVAVTPIERDLPFR